MQKVTRSLITPGVLLLALLLFSSGAATAAPAFVQYRYVVPGSAVSRINVGFSAAQAAGHVNLVAIGWKDSTSSVASVTDTRGNSYRIVAGPTVIPGVATQVVYIAENIVAAPAGGNVVKLAFSAPVTGADARIVEYSGVAAASAVDVAAGGTGNGLLTTSGSFATANANDLLVATNFVGGVTSGPGAGFTRRVITPRRSIIEDAVVTTAGNYVATAPQSPASWYIMHVVALRAATGGATPPAVALTGSPTSVATGASSMLTWSSTNATTCSAAGGWSGAKATSGSASTGALGTTTTYSLTCTGTGGSGSKSATVSVSASPGVPTVTLSASPAAIAGGAASTLTWSSTNATACTASGGWSGARAISGSATTGALGATTTYSLSCSGTGGSASTSATVTVSAVPPVPTVTFSASPASIASGASSTLTWSSTNATGCTASGGWSGGRATGGSTTTGALSATTTYSLTCSGTGGSASRSVTVTVSGSVASRFPLRVEPGKRYLVDAQGRPFLIQGDSPWLLISNLTREEVVRYLDDRQAKGFNTLLVELIERQHSVNTPANIYGDFPFTAGDEFSPTVEAYFSHAEYVIAQARQRGMLVLLTPSYMGYAGRETGWYPAMGRAGTATLRAYGQYVGNRFRAYNNILWVQGGDYNPPDRERLRAVLNGILDVEPTALHTFHGGRGTAALQWLGSSDPWLDVNNIYTTKDTVIAEAQGEYNRSTMPYFLIEAGYEDETASPTETRQQAWQAVLSGATGQVTGQESIWPFIPGVWTSQLNTEGASTLIHLRTLLESYSWWTLVPDFANAFLTGGVGSSAARAPAARAADGSFAILYTRDIRDLTVNIGSLAGPRVQARWYDPTSGSFATVSGSPFAATGSRVFRPTGTNARGKNDWVLVLDAIP